MENEDSATIIIERPMTKEEKAERAKWAKEQPAREKAEATEARRQAHVRFSDPVYMQWQAGEATKEQWIAARNKVIADYPIPGEGE